MNDFEKIMITILIVAFLLIGFVSVMHYMQDVIHDRDISSMKIVINNMVTAINESNSNQDRNIETLCGAIKGCEYGG